MNSVGITKTRRTTLTNTLLTVDAFSAWPLPVFVLEVNTSGSRLITTVNDATKTGCRWVVVFNMVV